MKRIKRIASLILAMAMVLAMGITVFAAGDRVDITVDTTVPDDAQSDTRTYTAYKIFDASLVKADDASQGVSYYLESPADDGKKTALEGISVDGKTVFSFSQSADKSRWIVIINSKSNANPNGIDFSESDTGKQNSKDLANALQSVVTNNSTQFPAYGGNFAAGVPHSVTQGYYLITSSLGTNMMLDTFVTQSITEKNEYPSNTKEEDKEVAEIGEIVTYTVNVNIPETVAEKDIVVVDTISKGLTMNTAIELSKEESQITILNFAENTEYVATDGEKQYLATIPAAIVKENAGQVLTLTYTAIVNSNAVVNVPETNKAHIEYDHFVSKDIEVEVVTYGFTVKKIDGAKVTESMTDDEKFALDALTGAEFSLWDALTDGNEIKVVSAGENLYRVADDDDKEEDFVKIAVGEATIYGLKNTTYYLQEDKAPEGYNMLTAREPITVTKEISAVGVDLAITNNAGSLLPSTGGIGTTIFYTVGGILVAAAGILLVVKKRMSAR